MRYDSPQMTSSILSIVFVFSSLLISLVVGCGEGQPALSEVRIDADSATPELAVKTFLEAVRTGNDSKADSMLTPVAREKIIERDMVVAPPGSDTARFSVGDVEIIGGNGARVSTRWSDVDANGKTREDQMVWMVRKETNGWRIAGVAANVFPGEPPLLLNFEDPDEMVRKQDMLRKRVASEAAKGQFRAQNRENPQDSVRR